MTYATIMTNVELERGSVKRTALAVDIALRFNSLLIGVTAAVPTQSPAYGAKIEATDLDRETKLLTEQLASAKKAFLAVTGQLDRAEWRGILDFPTDAVLREARSADLIIIGREQASYLAWPVDVGRTILQAGRPVLLVPPETDHLDARRILIGWKDTREARRAVRDAIPFLQKAEDVILLEVCEKGGEREALKRLDDVERYLGRHGVVPCSRFHTEQTNHGAEELIRVAQDEGAGLIVAGAYGHSRLGEWIFGGVTRDLLAESPLCCLLSH